MSKNVLLEYRGNIGEFPIKEFKLDNIIDHAAIIMIAKRASGKSFIVKAIMHHFRKKFDSGMVISPTDKMNGFYKNFVPDLFIHHKFNKELVTGFMSKQEIIIEKSKKKKEEGKNINTRSFLIMDDCLGDRSSWLKDDTITELLYNGRHYHIMYILTMQYPMGITPNLRSNFDYIFLLKDQSVSNQKKMYENYASIFPNFACFRAFFEAMTKNYGSLVIVTRDSQDTDEDVILSQVFYYKAPDLTNDKFVVGSKQYQYFNEMNLNKEWSVSKRFNPFEKISKDSFKNRQIKIGITK